MDTHLGPNVITDRTFITLGFEMLLQMEPLLYLGLVITIVPYTVFPFIRLTLAELGWQKTRKLNFQLALFVCTRVYKAG